MTAQRPCGDQPDPAGAAEEAAIRLLAAREHSRAELVRKLAQRGHGQAVITRVLDDLAARGLQSDERYTEQYVALRSRKGYGPLRIRAELQERGISPSCSECWLDLRDPAWRERLREAARAKFGADAPADRRELARRARFLEYRGFPQDQIRRLLLDE
jgi:regulatory protein